MKLNTNVLDVDEISSRKATQQNENNITFYRIWGDDVGTRTTTKEAK